MSIQRHQAFAKLRHCQHGLDTTAFTSPYLLLTILGAQAFVGARELSYSHKGLALTRPCRATRLILLQKSSTLTRCAVLGPHLHSAETSLPYCDATRPTSRWVPVVMPQLDPTSERGDECAGESEGGRV